MKSIPDMFAEIQNFFSDLSNAIGQGNIKEFSQSHKKQMLVLLGSICGFVLAMLLLSVILSFSSKPKPENLENIVPPLEEPLIMPKEPGMNGSFQYYREQKSEWTKEDVDKWFTQPDDSMIVEIEDANNTIISDILGVAP